MISTLTEQIESNLPQKLNVLDLADQFALSPWHFQRLFKSVVGDSLGSYLRGRRLARASELLVDTMKTIIEIAFEVGFSSHESFTRSFKLTYNMTPKQYRKLRTPVLTNKKPLLSADLLQHISQEMRIEPLICELPSQTVIGIEGRVPSPFTTRDPRCEHVGKTWFTLFERQNEIEHFIPATMYALTISPSGTFTEDVLTYIAGVPVSRVDRVPEGMVEHTLSGQKVAVFTMPTAIDQEITKQTIDYIYGYWLENSGCERGSGNDFEIFADIEDVYTGKFTSKYVLPLK